MRITPWRLVARLATASLGSLGATALGCGPAIEPTPDPRPTVVTSAYDLPPPDYTLDLTDFTFELDARRAVVTVKGDVRLARGRRPGESYVVDQGTLPERPSFGDYDEAFRNGQRRPLDASVVDVPGTSVLSVGTSMRETVRRTIVIARTSEGVVTYQALRMDLSAPK